MSLFKVESWIWYGVSVVIIILRFLSRLLLAKSVKSLQVEDYLMLLVLCFYTCLVVTLTRIEHVQTNLMKPGDEAYLTPESIKSRVYGSKLVLATEQCMLATIWGCKGCLLLLYARLTEGIKQQLAVKILAGYVVGTYILLEILYFAVWCPPFYNYWAVPTPSLSRHTRSSYIYVMRCSQLRERITAVFHSFQTIQLARVKLLLRSPIPSLQIVSAQSSSLIPARHDKQSMEIYIGDLMSGEAKDVLVNVVIMRPKKEYAASNGYKARHIGIEQFPPFEIWFSSSKSQRSNIISVPCQYFFSTLPASIAPLAQCAVARRQVELRISGLLGQALRWAHEGQQKYADELLWRIRELLNITKISLRNAYCNRAPVSTYGTEEASSQLISALRHDLNNFSEWIKYPEVFGQHWRKAVLQAIGVLLMQQSFSTDTWVETHLSELKTKAKDEKMPCYFDDCF
ncbi:hypothetical protein BDV24DRAFT_170402 [Aspergillus arachidicola]|uniref:Integral membrane protein n=1 Tax=Aspergillus arachidicola TaxID=656916 RepID=A0A5N6XMX9_9EURO|nr:hypothetical protein BDV24DRAFT_170402 [Aspergillus arachidicola]